MSLKFKSFNANFLRTKMPQLLILMLRRGLILPFSFPGPFVKTRTICGVSKETAGMSRAQPHTETQHQSCTDYLLSCSRVRQSVGGLPSAQPFDDSSMTVRKNRGNTRTRFDRCTTTRALTSEDTRLTGLLVPIKKPIFSYESTMIIRAPTAGKRGGN